jgi:choline kinase
LKALILAAGKGSRINNITNGSPKSLLPLGNHTLISHSLELLKKKGIDEIVVVTGYKRHEVIDHVKKVWPGKVDFVFNPHYETTNVLYSFWLGLKMIGKSDFLFLHADTVFCEAILDKLLSSKFVSPIILAVDKHECDEEAMKVTLSDNKVINVTKEMPLENSDGEFIGLAKISKDIYSEINDATENILEEKLFQSYFEFAVQRLIETSNLSVTSSDVTGLSWREVDFEVDYRAALKVFSI